MKKIILLSLTLPLVVACTSKGAYEMAASHQCQEQEKHAMDPNPAECWKAKEIDGHDYESYKREKEKIENELAY